MLPALFVSHGAPNLVLHRTAAHDFLKAYAALLPRPKAIVIVSAHFETAQPAVVTDPAPGMIYDFGGFEPELRRLVYPAPGDADLAERVAVLLDSAGLRPTRVARRGYDHGIWVPLMLLYPEADIPVVQVSVQPGRDAAHHYRLGRALAPLGEENVLVIGSGSLTHNLREVFGHGGMRSRQHPVEAWASAFADWMAERAAAGAVNDLLAWHERAPHAERNHPTDEHLMPFFVALGAAGEGASGARIHTSGEFGVLMMDAYAFSREEGAGPGR